MKTAMRFLAVVLVAAPMVAAEPPGFAMWTAAELKKRDEALSKLEDLRHHDRLALWSGLVGARLENVEERHLATDPVYLLITTAAAAMSLWAWRLVRLSPR